MEIEMSLDVMPVVDRLVTEILSPAGAVAAGNISAGAAATANPAAEQLLSGQGTGSVEELLLLLGPCKDPVAAGERGRVGEVRVPLRGNSSCRDEALAKCEEAGDRHLPCLPSSDGQFLSCVVLECDNGRVPAFSAEGAVSQNVEAIPEEGGEVVGSVIENHRDTAVSQDSVVDEPGCELLVLHSVAEESSCSHRNYSNPVVICQLEGGTQVLWTNSSGTQELQPVHLIPECHNQLDYLQSDGQPVQKSTEAQDVIIFTEPDKGEAAGSPSTAMEIEMSLDVMPVVNRLVTEILSPAGAVAAGNISAGAAATANPAAEQLLSGQGTGSVEELLLLLGPCKDPVAAGERGRVGEVRVPLHGNSSCRDETLAKCEEAGDRHLPCLPSSDGQFLSCVVLECDNGRVPAFSAEGAVSQNVGAIPVFGSFIPPVPVVGSPATPVLEQFWLLPGEQEFEDGPFQALAGTATSSLETNLHRTAKTTLEGFPYGSGVTKPKKPCNCTKSQCLKLYCDCFANGHLCANCNCSNCYNSQLHETERFKAIKACLERNPESFLLKAGKLKIGEIKPQHNKGCNCKRSGCLKNYCQCFEAKITCSSVCKCVDCKNCEDSTGAKNELNVLNFLDGGTSEGSSPVLASTVKPLPTVRRGRHPNVRVSAEEVSSACTCLLVEAEEAERRGYSVCQAEQMIMEEFGRCLSQILHK